MKSFVEQSERHYVSVPRHHLWSRIYIILRVLVYHICRVYVICMYFRVFALCTCACLRVTTILLCLLSCFLTLVLSLAFFRSYLSRILSPPPFRALATHIPAHTSFPPAFLTFPVSYFLTFRVRSPLFDILDSRVSTGLNSTSGRGNARNRTGDP